MKSFNIYLFSIILSVILTGCKSQNLETSAPFKIVEKNYFYWIGGKQGTQGTTITLEGQTTSSNISFSKVYFQNHEYNIVPEFHSAGFVIKGTYSKFRKGGLVMHKDPAAEYGNAPPDLQDQFPFDLEDDEAVLLYSVNGLEGYHKISGIKQLEKVYMP